MTWTVKFPGNINITNNVYDVIIVGSINIVNLPLCVADFCGSQPGSTKFSWRSTGRL